ncbi:MAG: hypothetical protein SFY67_05570 [Candidatus Melainabacteria bacterium]|nr:hypothetical protein [Candidatus Melainabacteria bacterium]
MNNDTGSSNPWFSGKRKTQEELQVPQRTPRTTENDLLATRRLVGAPNETDGKTRWFGVRQSYTNLPAHKLINELQQGRYDPYAAIDGIRTQSLDQMDIPARAPMPSTSIMPSTNLADRNKEPVYTPPITQDISTDWTVNYATPMLPPLPDEVKLNPQNAQDADGEPEYKFQPEINPMQFVQQYGNELPTESLEEICCDDFSPIENIMKARSNDNTSNETENVFQFNSASRLPAFKRPPRSLT